MRINKRKKFKGTCLEGLEDEHVHDHASCVSRAEASRHVHAQGGPVLLHEHVHRPASS